MSWIEVTSSSIHYTVNYIGISANLLLIYLVFKCTPKTMRSYAVLVLNMAVTDLVACLSEVFTQQRMIPSGFTLAYVYYGICSKLGKTACFLGYCIFLYTSVHSLFSTVLSFFYRHYILVNKIPPPVTVVLSCCIINVPTFFLTIMFSTTHSDSNEVRYLISQTFPDYNLTGLTMVGHVSILERRTLTMILYVVLTMLPSYALILYFRRRVITCLDRMNINEGNKRMHRNLLKALSIQACLPLFYNISVVTYLIEQFGLYHHQALEHLPCEIVTISPSLSPLISIYFIKPYRREVLKLIGFEQSTTNDQVTTKPSTTTA